ncbi:MAG: right-handed parallel beta-helix repeat-containing protein, partial [Acidobacteria bacterium]|nr:right-handed parallel beta-helix repeat-containing protein [Acidobacteriota bacterium]
ALDASGNIYVAGDTSASDFPVANPLQAAQAGLGDIFVTVLAPMGASYLFSTYLGGCSTESCCADIAVGGSGDASVTGITSSLNFPTLNPMQPGNAGQADGFVTRIAVGPPSPLAPLDLRVEEDRLEWTPVANATGYDVVRGDVGTLLTTRGDFTAATAECLADDYAPTMLPFTAAPARGQAFWFLARWVTPAQVGSFDSGGQGQVGLRDAEIDASPLACLAALRPHPPIVIDGDGGFTAANGVIRGSGNLADPYIIASWDIAGPPGGAGILIGNTNAHFVIRNVSVHGGQYGMLLNTVHNGRIERSRATGNTHGIRIFSGGDLAIEENISSSNTQGSGIDVLGASNVLVRGNTLAANMVGINLDGSAGARVHHNNILSNALQAIDQRGGPNAWDDGYPAGGNYWTNYQGIDQCSGPAQDQCTGPDGFGDTPYVVGPDNSLDRYPLMILPGSEFDTVPPTVAITSPPDGAVFTTVPIVVWGAAADAGSGVRRAEVRVNGGPWIMAAGTSPWSLSVGLDFGGNLIEARSFDHAGNVSSVASISVTYQAPALEMQIMTDKAAYAQGEPVAITLLLTNRGSAPVTLHFPSACEAFFAVQNMSNAVVYDYRFHVGCPAIVTERTVQPGETVTYDFNWTQVDDSGAPVPAPADYRIRGFLDSAEFVPDAFTTISVGP